MDYTTEEQIKNITEEYKEYSKQELAFMLWCREIQLRIIRKHSNRKRQREKRGFRKTQSGGRKTLGKRKEHGKKYLKKYEQFRLFYTQR